MDNAIAAYEARFEISSDELRRRVGTGMMEETRDVLAWLMLLRRRELSAKSR